MKTEELKTENVGKPVLVDSINGFNDAKATFRAWSKDRKTAIISLDSMYGKGFVRGRLLEVSVSAIRLAGGNHDPS